MELPEGRKDISFITGGMTDRKKAAPVLSDRLYTLIL